MNTRLYRGFVSASLLTGGFAAACSSNDASGRQLGDTSLGPKPSNLVVTAEQRQRIHLVTVKTVAFRPTVDATGNVAFNGDHSTQVLSPVSGPAIRVIAEPGEFVHKGDVLAEVSSPDFAAAVATYRKAETAFRNAKRIYVQDSALFKNDALARTELEQAQSDVASADADVGAAIEGMRSLGVDEDADPSGARRQEDVDRGGGARADRRHDRREAHLARPTARRRDDAVLHHRRSLDDVGVGERLCQRSGRRFGWPARRT